MNTPNALIEDSRIALLPYTHDDDKDMADCWKDAGTQQGFNCILDENCEQFFQFEISQFPYWVTVWDKQLNCKVGSLRLGLDEVPDLAIWIYPKYRSMGYGTASFRLSLKYLFSHYHYPELAAGCFMDNEKSLRMLKRIGFTRCPSHDEEEINCFSGEPTIMYGFRITAEEVKE